MRTFPATKNLNWLALAVVTLILVLSSCGNQGSTTRDNKTADSDFAAETDSTANLIHYTDTINRLLREGLSADTFEYVAYYNDESPYELLYFKSGNLFRAGMKHAVILYSANDTTVFCELYTNTGNRWSRSPGDIRMPIRRFSPAYFGVNFDDYNFDGLRDMKTTFYHSMGMVYTYGYLLTFDTENNALTLHPETLAIPSMEIDRPSKSIVSIEHANPNATKERYKVISRYSWTGDSLRLVSEKKVELE